MDDIQSRDWLTKEEAAAFIGKNTEYYLDKWKSHPDSFYKGWNWAAMFFRVEWMAYRKMYAEAVIVLIAVVAFGLLLDGFLGLFGITLPDSFSRLIIQILLGAFANGLYRNKAVRILHKTSHMSDAQRINYLTQKGGTSILGLIVFMTLEIAVIVIPLIIVFYLY